MTILYLHGMASSHESEIGAAIRKYMPDAEVLIPDLSIDPNISFPLIDKLLKENKVDVIVGHSLGGFMAQKYRGYKKVMVNSCLGTTFFRFFKGKNKYKHNRYDGNPYFVVTDQICEDYKRLEKSQFENISTEEQQLTVGCFATWDLYTRLACHWFKQHYTQTVSMPGRHFPKEETVRDYVVPAIRRLIG